MEKPNFQTQEGPFATGNPVWEKIAATLFAHSFSASTNQPCFA